MQLITELRRRNVFRMAALYLGAAWLVMQVVDLLIDRGPLPESLGPITLTVLAIGFPIAVVLSWFFEVTPEGVTLDEDIKPGGDVRAAGRRLDFVVIAVLAAAVLMFAWDKWWLRDVPSGYTNSVAVLAFADLSPDGDQAWFSDGLSEEIINSLAQLAELKVTARTSAFHFKGLDVPIPEIAATLGVAHVVEGSVRRAGDRMRITAQLIKADDGFHLWSETYDRSTDDVFTVQEDIAENIANALDIYLDEERRERMFQTGTRNVQAYEAYLRGLDLFNEWHSTYGEGLLWEAQRWFERALDLDPEFALAHFFHGDTYFHYGRGRMELPPGADPGLTPEVALDLLFQDYERAIEFADDEEVRLFYEVERTLFSDDWSNLRSLLDRLGTIRENPANLSLTLAEQEYGIPLAYRAFALLGRSGIASNYRHFRKMHELDPVNPLFLHAAVNDAIFLGSHDEALELIERLETIDSRSARAYRQNLLATTGEWEAPLTWPPGQTPGGRALDLALYGRPDEARALIEEMPLEDRRRDYRVAWVLYLLGETELPEEFWSAIDARPVYSNVDLTYFLYTLGGQLIWDLEWTPNYAARLAELGVELESFEFAPSAAQP